nr:MAG TPA: Cas system-associated protein [Caudoviricetes sp.]
MLTHPAGVIGLFRYVDEYKIVLFPPSPPFQQLQA